MGRAELIRKNGDQAYSKCVEHRQSVKDLPGKGNGESRGGFREGGSMNWNKWNTSFAWKGVAPC